MANDMNVDTTSQTITAQKGHVQALAFARKGGAALSALLAGIATAKEVERRGPIQTMIFLEMNYSDDEAAAIPVVGSKQGETGNLPYDRYTAEVHTKDGKKKVPGSWFTDVVKSTDEWAKINQRLSWLNNEGDDIPDDVSKLGDGQKAEEKARLKDRVSDMRTALTKGAMLFHHVAEVDAINPERIKVKLPVRKDAVTGGMEVYGGKIRLIDPAKELEDKVLSLGSFLALKPDQIEGVKDIANLEKTGARASKKTPPAGSTAYPVPKTVEALLTCFNITSTALDDKTDEGKKLESMLLSACAKVGKEGDEAALSVGTICMILDNVWTTIKPRFDSVNVDRVAAAVNAKAAGRQAGSNPAA